MTVQVQRFVQETQKWRTARSMDSFLDVQAFLETLPWAVKVSDEQWAVYEQIGMALAHEVPRFHDLVTLVNSEGQLVIRTERGAAKASERGSVYICVGPVSSAIDVSSYYEVKGSYVHGTVPLKDLQNAVKWVDWT